MPFVEFGKVGESLREGVEVLARNLGGGHITAETLIMAGGTKGTIRSQNYDEATVGWAIFGDGKAFFYGDVLIGGRLTVGGGAESIVFDPFSWGSAQALIIFEVGAATSQPQIGGAKTDGGLLLIAGGDATPASVEIYKSRIDFAMDGDRWTMTPDYLTKGVGEGGIRVGNGSAALPTVSFASDTNTGIYRLAENSIGFATQASLKADIDQNGVFTINPNNANGRVALALQIERAWEFRQFGTGATTELYLASTADKTFNVGGDTSGKMLRVLHTTASSVLELRDNLTDVGNHEALVLNKGTGTTLQKVGYYSSWAHTKTDIKNLSNPRNPWWKREWFMDIETISSRKKKVGAFRGQEDMRTLSFLMDNLIEHTNLLTTKGIRVGDSPDLHAILAVTVDYVQHLEHRLANLEEQLAHAHRTC